MTNARLRIKEKESEKSTRFPEQRLREDQCSGPRSVPYPCQTWRVKF